MAEPGAELQRGRGEFAAETISASCSAPCPTSASMRPRRIRRGNHCGVVGKSSDSFCFNEAAANSPRKPNGLGSASKACVLLQ